MKSFIFLSIALAISASNIGVNGDVKPYFISVYEEGEILPVPTKCPKEDKQRPVHIAHETDCDKFYKCSHGKPYLQYCKEGLHFNPRKQICDYPWAAGCSLITTTESEIPPTESTTPTPETTTESEIPPTESTTPKPETTSTEPTTPSCSTSCPAVDPAVPTYLPHECVCTKYYKCRKCEQILQECGPGLHFNPTAQKCDLPQNVGCGSTPASSTPDPIIPGECPATNGDEVVHLPHETKCSLFYKCDNGNKALFKCPGNLHFNPKKQVCDWASNLNCKDKTYF